MKLSTFREMLLIFGKTITLLWKTSPPKFLLVLLIDCVSGAIVPAGLWVWKSFIDALSTVLVHSDQGFSDMYVWLFIHFCLILLSSLMGTMSSYIQNIYSTILNKTISEIILRKAACLDMKDFDDAKVYNHIQKANDESLARSVSILQTLVALIKNITSLAGIIGLLFVFRPSVVLLCVISAIPMFYISVRIMNKWFEVFNKRFENNRFVKHLKSLAIANHNIKELKIYNATPFLIQTIVGILDQYLKDDRKIRRRFLVESSIVESIDKGIVYLIKIFVVFIGIGKKLSIGSLAMYITAVDNLKDSISNILSLLSTAYEDCLYVQNIFRLLDMPVEPQEEKPEFPAGFRSITFNNVSFTYPGTDRPVLTDLNFTLEAGRSYVLVGQNGSGKTTLIKLLLNLYSPTEGEILVDDVNIAHYNRNSLFANISAVFQDFIQYPFDIKTNIGIGNPDLMDDLDRIKQAAVLTGADSFIAELPGGYQAKLQKEWSDSVDLSLGQWQKLAITRAMMKPAPILILDEPTASLDAVAEHDIYLNFADMSRNKLCLMVTHRFVSSQTADSILVLESGRLAECGTHRELMARQGIYAHLYCLQAEKYDNVGVPG